MIRNILVIALLLLLSNFSMSQNLEIKEESKYTSNSPEIKNVREYFKTLSKEIGNIYKKDFKKVEFYIQVHIDSPIKKVSDFSNIGSIHYTSFNIIRNKEDQVIYIIEFPFSESGDWNIAYESYFDEKGNLVAFIRNCSFFNSKCADIVHEKSEFFYTADHNLVMKTYEIKDGKNKILDYNKCDFRYRFPYTKFTTLTDYLANHPFEF